MEKIDKAIDILQAFKEGKKIEFLGLNKEWDYTVNEEQIFNLLAHNIDGIILGKEPEYRPYNSGEEFVKNCKIHGPYISETLPLWYGDRGIMHYCPILNVCEFVDFAALLKDYKWQHGHPCGVEEN